MINSGAKSSMTPTCPELPHDQGMFKDRYRGGDLVRRLAVIDPQYHRIAANVKIKGYYAARFISSKLLRIAESFSRKTFRQASTTAGS